MSTRKRTRAANSADNDEDELSPAKKSSRKIDLESSKKRKLNARGFSPTPATGPPRSHLLGSVTKVAGRIGKENGKENKQPQAEQGDEIEEDEEDELNAGTTNNKNEADIWEVPDEGVVSKRKPGRPPKGIKGRGKVKYPEGELGDESGFGDNSSEKAPPSSKKNGRGSKKSTPSVKTAEDTTPAAKSSLTKRLQVSGKGIGRGEGETPKRGRPRKKVEDSFSTITSGKKIAEEELRSSTKNPTSRGPRKSDILKKDKAYSREVLRAKLSRADDNGHDEDILKEDMTASVKRRSSQDLKFKAGPTTISESESEQDDEENTEVEEEEQIPKSLGKGRQRALHDVAVSVNAVPKGILTPSKPRSVKPRKSVVFEGQEELDLGFKDLPVSARKKLPKGKIATSTKEVDTGAVADRALPKSKKPSSKKVEEISALEEEDDSESSADEVACGICGGLKSRKPNAIILCDKCDFAVHQKCYGVITIPEGDWFCKDCQAQEGDLVDPEVEEAIANEIQGIDRFGDHLRSVQRLVLDRLTNQKRIKLHGHAEEIQKVHQVVEQTVLAGEGNSMLVIGARGCGKTTLVESVIADLAEHREHYHVVRLNGFIHTDDKLALREIWRQLGREMEVEDDGKINAADTLASLLALLSHPSETTGDQNGETAKSVIFVLDEFDLFTTHSRQTLLYNLFDIAQARKAPIVVLGLTTRVDVVEALEKRVKSRFSHRYVYLTLPRSLGAFWEICRDALIVTKEDLEKADVDVEVGGLDKCLSFWETSIDELYSKNETFKHYLQSHFYRTKSVSEFLTSCILPIANLSAKRPSLSGKAFITNVISLTPPDSKLHILQGLSELELALLIAAARLDIILDTDTCNFAMAYDEYSSLTSRHRIQTSSSGMAALGSGAKIWGREVALGAWERLAEYSLLVPANLGGGSSRDTGTGGRMWKLDVGLEEITGSVDGLSTVMAKWCREI